MIASSQPKRRTMESSNPVFKRSSTEIALRGNTTVVPSSAELDNLYNAPAASSIRTGCMTIDDVVARTAMLFVVLVTAGALAWKANLSMGFAMIGMIGALVLGLVLTMSKKVKPWAALSYAGLEGLALGAISHVYEATYPGIISQALIGTIAAFVGVLFAYKSKRVRVTPKFTRVMMGALIGYMVLGFGSMIAGMFGVGHGYGLYGVSGLGLLLAVGGVGLASFFLIMDFDQIEKMVAAGVPHEESWRAGFGLMVTVVWLYLEIVRLLSILRDR